MECSISKFAKNIELGGAIYYLQGREFLKRPLERLEHWAIITYMKSNKHKMSDSASGMV